MLPAESEPTYLSRNRITPQHRKTTTGTNRWCQNVSVLLAKYHTKWWKHRTRRNETRNTHTHTYIRTHHMIKKKFFYFSKGALLLQTRKFLYSNYFRPIAACSFFVFMCGIFSLTPRYLFVHCCCRYLSQEKWELFLGAYTLHSWPSIFPRPSSEVSQL